MGMMRKMMSLSTAGLVDWRNDSEREAAGERTKSKAYKERSKMERELRERELAIREREVALAERRAQAETISVNDLVTGTIRPGDFTASTVHAKDLPFEPYSVSPEQLNKHLRREP